MGGAEAQRAVLDALGHIGVPAHLATRSESSVDLWIDLPGDNRTPVEVHYTSLASVDGLPRQLDRRNRQRPAAINGHEILKILVADRVTAAAKDLLREQGWGWLDLRGHLHLSAPGLFVHTDIPPAITPQKRRSDPFSGNSGIEVAVELLLDPSTPAGIRVLAKRIDRSPSTVSETISRLRHANLVDDDLQAVIPDLFWSLASAWHPASVDIASLPSRTDHGVLAALQVGLGADTPSGWALGDSLAAIVYDAPIALRTHYPPVFYVPDERILRRSVQLLGAPSEPSRRAATLRSAPTRAVCSRRVTDFGDSDWPLAHPLFVALDLAQDRGRGREILGEWTPPNRWHRVW